MKPLVYLVTDTSWWMEEGWRIASRVVDMVKDRRIFYAIPSRVMRELDGLKKNPEKGDRARAATKEIDRLIRDNRGRIAFIRKDLYHVLSSKADEEAIAVAEHLKNRGRETYLLSIDYAQKAFARQRGIPCLESVENLFPTTDVRVGDTMIYNGAPVGSSLGTYFFLSVLIFGIILILAGSPLCGLVFSGIALVCLLNRKWKELRRYNSRFEPRHPYDRKELQGFKKICDIQEDNLTFDIRYPFNLGAIGEEDD